MIKNQSLIFNYYFLTDKIKLVLQLEFCVFFNNTNDISKIFNCSKLFIVKINEMQITIWIFRKRLYNFVCNLAALQMISFAEFKI